MILFEKRNKNVRFRKHSYQGNEAVALFKRKLSTTTADKQCDLSLLSLRGQNQCHFTIRNVVTLVISVSKIETYRKLYLLNYAENEKTLFEICDEIHRDQSSHLSAPKTAMSSL